MRVDKGKLIDMLILHEGLELKPYQCTADKTTIGVGRNLSDVGITDEEAKFLLLNDLQRIQKEVEHWTFMESLAEPRQAVLLDMVFNMGISRFNANTWVKTFAAIQYKDFEKAANEMLESKYLLLNDLQRIQKEIAHWNFLEKLNEPRQAVILDMVFNMGVSRFNANTCVKTFAAIQDNDWEKAANEMLESKWAKQVGQRAIRLSQMMRKGVWYVD